MKKGLTLVECLVVIVIIALLSSMALSVYAGGLKRSKESVDISNMRQLYLGVSLYEEDNALSPPILPSVMNYVRDAELYKSPLDVHRKPIRGGMWTATPFVPCTGKLSEFKVSYGYIKTYPPYDVIDSTWHELRLRSEVGMLASPWFGKVIKYPPNAFACPNSSESALDVAGPAFDGPILRINMDGSFFRLRENRYKYMMGSVHDLFFNRS